MLVDYLYTDIYMHEYSIPWDLTQCVLVVLLDTGSQIREYSRLWQRQPREKIWLSLKQCHEDEYGYPWHRTSNGPIQVHLI